MSRLLRIAGPVALIGCCLAVFLGAAQAGAAGMEPAIELEVGGMPPTHAGQTISGQSTEYSTNWAGYAATSSTAGYFKTVTATWVQPTLSCGSQTSYAAFWGGLDGANDASVEQTGTLGECVRGVASYTPWYELYPQEAIVTISGRTVAPGDTMTATVTADGSGKFTMVLSDNGATKWSVKEEQTATTKSLPLQESAEAIVEAPSSSGKILPLANFGTTSFEGVTYNSGMPIGSAPDLELIDTVSNGGQLEASTSSLTEGEDFSVSYAAPSPPGHHHR